MEDCTSALLAASGSPIGDDAEQNHDRRSGQRGSDSDALRRSVSEIQRYRPSRAALLRRTSALRQQQQLLAAANSSNSNNGGETNDGSYEMQTLQLPSEVRFSLTVDSIEEDFEEDPFVSRGKQHEASDAERTASATEGKRSYESGLATVHINALRQRRALIINEDSEDQEERESQGVHTAAASRQSVHSVASASSECELPASAGTLTLNKPNRQNKQIDASASASANASLINRTANVLNSAQAQAQEERILLKTAVQHHSPVNSACANVNCIFHDSSCNLDADDRNRSYSLSVHQINQCGSGAIGLSVTAPATATATAAPGWSPAQLKRARKRSDTLTITEAARLGLTSSIYVNRMARRSVTALPSNALIQNSSRSTSFSSRSLSTSATAQRSNVNINSNSMRSSLRMVDAMVQTCNPNDASLTMCDNSATGSLLSISGSHGRYKASRIASAGALKDEKRHSANRQNSDLLHSIGADYLRYAGIQTFKQLQPVKELQKHVDSAVAVFRHPNANANSIANHVPMPRSSSTLSLSDSANASPEFDFNLAAATNQKQLVIAGTDEDLICTHSAQRSDSVIDKCECGTTHREHSATIDFNQHTEREPIMKINLLKTDSQNKDKDEPVANTTERTATISRQPVARRLARRKELFEQRRLVADCAFTACLVGLLLMITENEITLGVARPFVSQNHSDHEDENRSDAIISYKESTLSVSLKTMISVSTVILEVFIAVHHILEVRLFLIENGVADWRLAMTRKRVGQFLIEFLVCAIHPMPFLFHNSVVLWPEVLSSTKPEDLAKVPFDVFFSVPMFLRSYLAFRVVVIHSRLLTDASSRSIGALNRITFNTRFVMKTFMTTCPGTVLLAFIILLWLGFGWILRLCDSYHKADFYNYGNAIWLIAVTFFSIGYGDIVPVTLCGRVISILTGITGAGSTAFVVAVVARKLELSRAEKHVHNFMLDTHLTKSLKNAAANVLRETWLIYKNTRLVKRVNSGKVRDHQRKFLQALQNLRKVKLDQRKLNDNANQLIDVGKLHSQIADRMDESQEEQTTMMNRIESLEDKINTVQKSLDLLPQIILEALARHNADRVKSPQDLAFAVPGSLIGAAAVEAVTNAYLADNIGTEC